MIEERRVITKTRRTRRNTKQVLYKALFVCFVPSRYRDVSAQTFTQRGFVEGSVILFPQDAVNDTTRIVGDLRVRDEIFIKPAPWIQFAGGLDLRLNSHDQAERAWRVDVSDRGALRPSIAVRRLSATVTHKGITVDAGKQFIRWGKTDIVTPTDRFAPRDFMNVVDTEFLAVTGVRAAVQAGSGRDTLEVVWLPRFTPSRLPRLDQRWTAVPAGAAAIPIVDAGAVLPEGSEAGVRWSHVGNGIEFSLSYFDGFNHLPDIDAATTINAQPARPAERAIAIRRDYPAILAYGADVAVPMRWLTIKAETAYVASASAATPGSDDYLIYVVQLERQTGEWVFVAGYAGEHVTAQRAALTFAPDRGLTRSIVARASYTIDATRSVALESAARQSGGGVYAKGEYSQARGQHWRTTITGVVIAGASDDFLGQYNRNSHAAVALRYSF